MGRSIVPTLQIVTLPVLAAAMTAVGLLLPDPAVALDFGFQFNERYFYTRGTIQPDGPTIYQWVTLDGVARPVGDYEVEGTILNLADDTAAQVPTSIVITKASHDPLSVGTYIFSRGSGFEVGGGEMKKAVWIGTLASQNTIKRLVFSTTPMSQFWPLSRFARLDSGPLDGFYDYDENANIFYTCACSINASFPEGSAPVFTPLTPPKSAPGPVPILEAAAAYRASQTLKRRIKQATLPI